MTALWRRVQRPLVYVYLALTLGLGGWVAWNYFYPPPCASAQTICPIGSSNIFSGTVGIQGGTAFTLTLTGAPTGNRTVTIQDANQTLVGRATTDTLTNKSISLGSNTLTTTSAQLATAISDETGSGAAVFATSPTLVTPTLGVATGTRLGLGQVADSSAVLAATGQYFSTMTTTTVAVDWNSGNVQRIVLANGAQTFTFANPKAGGRYILLVQQPAAGAAGTASWPGSVNWGVSGVPTLSATNSKVDVIGFVYDGTAAAYYGGFNLGY